MKNFIVLLFVTFVNFNVSAQEAALNTGNTGTICFIRSTGFVGSASAFKTFIDGEFVCKLNNKRYSFHEVPVGKHACSVQFGGKKSKEKAEKFEVEVNAGEITYVQLVLETGAFVNNVYCEEVTKNTAEGKMKELQEDDACL